MSSKNLASQAFSLSTVRAFFALPRPINGLITFASVVLGGWLGAKTLSVPLLLAAASAALITGGGNAFNDLCGLVEDRINKPHRPLPSGRLSLGLARFETALLLIAGLAFSLPLSHASQSIALLAVLLLILYNTHFKRIPLLGNITVSTLGALAFLYGGFAVHLPHAALWPAIFAFVFHLGREILKDLEDCAGDRLLTGSTVPLRWGEHMAKRLIVAIYALLIAIMPLPALAGPYGHRYLVFIAVLNILLIHILLSLRSAQVRDLHRASHLLKVGMLLGIGAFFFEHLRP